MKTTGLLLGALLFLGACKKASLPSEVAPDNTKQYTLYTIRAGNQYCDQAKLEAANYQELKFLVKFDSSAIYKTIDAKNQGDINKLFGFSDNDSAHHTFSARFGWGWSNNALNLYAYNYNNGIRSSLLLGSVAIGQEHLCSIKVAGNVYVFTLNGKQFTLPRASTTATGRGYKLLPYFGGDEFAPHDINILIKEL